MKKTTTTALLLFAIMLTGCADERRGLPETTEPESTAEAAPETAEKYTFGDIGDIHFKTMIWIRERGQAWLGYVYASEGSYFLFDDNTDEQFKTELAEHIEGLPVTVSYTREEYTREELKKLYEDMNDWLAEKDIMRLRGSRDARRIYFSVAEDTDDELKSELAERVRELPVCISYLDESRYPEVL